MSDTPDTTEIVARALYEHYDEADPLRMTWEELYESGRETCRRAVKVAIEAHNKALAKAVPKVDYLYAPTEVDDGDAWANGFNTARRFLLGDTPDDDEELGL